MSTENIIWRFIMSEELENEFGADIVTIVDDDGQEFNLEYLDTMDYNGSTFHAYLPADMDENDPDYGMIILRAVPDEETGEELLESIDDDDELTDVYNHFMVLLFDDEEEESEEADK